MTGLVVGSTSAALAIRVRQESLYLDDPRFGVVYGSTSNQAAKVQAAWNLAAAAAGGGRVVNAGLVYCGNTELQWPSSGTSGGALIFSGLGDGPQANQSPSALYWDQDSPDPAPAAGDSTGTRFGIRIPHDAFAWRIEEMCLQGPGQTVSIGQTPCKMSGVFVSTRGWMQHVTARSWGAAVGIINDHQRYRDCDFSGNGYGIDFMDNATGGLADMIFSGINVSGQTRASIALSDSNAITNTRFEGNGHFGAAPFGIYRYAGQEGVARGGQAMTGVVFDNQSFEFCGNAMIYDEPDNGSWSNITFLPPAETSTGGSAKWPGKPWPMAKIQIAQGGGFHWVSGGMIPQPDDITAMMVSAKDFSNFTMDDPTNLFDAINTYSHPVFEQRAGSTGAGFTGGRLGLAGVGGAGGFRLGIGTVATAETIPKGSLVEAYLSNQVRLARNDATSEILGVATRDVGAGDVCVFASNGARSGLVVRNQSGSTIANGALMAPDGAHQGCVKAWSAGDQKVGRAYDGAITTGSTGPVSVIGS